MFWAQGNPKIIFAVYNNQKELALRGKPIPNNSEVVLFPDGKLAAYGVVYLPGHAWLVLDIIDLEKLQVVAGFNPIDLNVNVAEIAPNNDLVMAGVGNKVAIWGSRKLVQLPGHTQVVTALEFSLQGEILASGDYDGKTILWTAK